MVHIPVQQARLQQPTLNPLPLLFSQLLLEVNYVPDLSAGITCSFGPQAQVEGHVNGNRVMCLSPAGKEVPQIPEGQGEQNKKGRMHFMWEMDTEA